MDSSSEKRSATVLLVDDEAPLRRAFARYLRRAGHTVRCAATVEEGRSALSENEVDIAFVDFRLPDGSGAELIRWAITNNRAQSVYCMTGSMSGRTTSEVLQAGCVDILEKPIDVDRLAALIDFQDIMGVPVRDPDPGHAEAEAHIIEAGELPDHSSDLPGPFLDEPQQLDEDFQTWRHRCAPEIVGRDDQLVEALLTVRSVADTECTVLITGESGTGKELVARALHAGSPRCQGPFVALNCAAIPESMVEAELFGHARGAFTGAHTTRGGRVATASGGTLFLDEIGDMPLAAQAKLLRMLQDRTIIPVGSDTPVTIDVRIVAATNQDLEAMVTEGRFRLDLYFRLNVIPVELPPLRDRGHDIVELAHYFLLEANRHHRRKVSGLDASAERALLSHDWPGNVRELAHLLERTVLLKASGIIKGSDLRLRRSNRTAAAHRLLRTSDGLDLRSAIDQVERQLIDEALERTGGNRTEAAALLGVNRTTLVEKIRKHNSSPV
jgi:DNA-binding NtrC family response regulator